LGNEVRSLTNEAKWFSREARSLTNEAKWFSREVRSLTNEVKCFSREVRSLACTTGSREGPSEALQMPFGGPSGSSLRTRPPG
jgi:hypothetical protein